MNSLGYAINFFLCEILALFNVIGMIYFTDRFLGYQFSTVRENTLVRTGARNIFNVFSTAGMWCLWPPWTPIRDMILWMQSSLK